jgi:hypothetical protein
MMPKDTTRSRLIQLWLVTVVLVVVGGIASGANVTVGSGVMLLAFGLVPPTILLTLWPEAQPPTAADVLRHVDRDAKASTANKGVFRR